MADVITSPEVHTETAVQLDIPCEWAENGQQCGRPADVWVIMHDVFGDCRSHRDGALSTYMCHDCWDPIATTLAANLRLATLQPGIVPACMTCHMHFHRWSDLVFRVVAIRGTKR